MSLNLIDFLKQHVSAMVLEGDSQNLLVKSQALSAFYPVFLSILHAYPERLETLQNHLKPTLSDVFQGHPVIQQQFLQQVSATAPQAEIAAVLNQSIAPTLTLLAEQAGNRDAIAIEHLLQQHAAEIQQALPEWATILLSVLGAQAETIETVDGLPSQAIVTETQQEKARSGWLFAVLGLLIFAFLLAFLLRACDQRRKVESTTATSVVGTQPAMFQISMGHQGELVTCRIYSGDLNYIEILQGQVKQIFNHANGCGADHQSKYHQTFINQDALPSVLKLLKDVPNIMLTWQGTEILIQSSNNARAQAIAREIQQLTPNMQVRVVPPQLDAAETMKQDQQQNAAIYSSVERAEQALAQLDVNQLRPLDIATALNMQIINFDSGSAKIPELNKSVLTQTAVLIQRVPNVHVTIMGHTDAEGDAQQNKVLSQQRARAVAEYFVHQGVEVNKISVLGYGEEQPVADNATDEGRFKNRRIEFKVENTETGKVSEVTEAAVKPIKTS